MSAAASKLEIESPSSGREQYFDDEDDIPESEKRLLEKLAITSPASSRGPVIAVDLDDVLSQTNDAVAQCEFGVHSPKCRYILSLARRA